MYKIMAIVCGLFLFSAAAIGNPAQRFDAFAGYSYSDFGPNLPQGLPLSAGSPAISHSLHGWNGSLELKVLPVLGIVADFSGHSGNETTEVNCPGSPFACEANNANVGLYTFTVGPQVFLPLGRIVPYAHALFGGALYRDPASLRTDGSFADVLGGGIDVAVIPWLAWRVQADAVQTRFSIVPLLPNKQNSLRLSTGLVFRF